MIFDQATAEEMARMRGTEQGQYLAGRQEMLIRLLARPARGERLLCVGTATGESLASFLDLGCLTTALVPASCLAAVAREKTGTRVDFRVGPVDDFPFSDDEFDLVVLQGALEFTPDHRRVIDEAIRVSRGQVFIGVKNRCSPFFLGKNSESLFPQPLRWQARAYHIAELLSLVRNRLGSVDVRWGSHIFFPYRLGKKVADFEKHIPLLKNPCGAFLGLSFPVSYRFRSVQNVIVNGPGVFKEKGREPAQGLVRGGK